MNWVDVKDDLPEGNLIMEKSLLMWVHDKRRKHGYSVKGFYSDRFGFYSRKEMDYTRRFFACVTHWAKIEPPKC